MKKVINGKLYNTETAKALATWTNGDYGSVKYTEETLYKKRTGEYFLYGLSGAAGKYAERVSTNTFTGGDEVIPMTEEDAKDWMEEYASTNEYIQTFGNVVE